MTALPGLTPGTWTVDPAHTEVGFTARHLMVTKVRGRFTAPEGTVTVAEELGASTATVSVSMASVDTGNAERDGHLRSGDFFDTEKFPTMTFVSTSFDGSTLTGDLTIKDATHPVTFDVDFGGVATDPWGNTKAGFSAEADIDRRDWGLTWNVALDAGGMLVSEKIHLVLDVQLLKA